MQLVYIRETEEHEHGQWTIVLEDLPLTIGFRTLDEAKNVCEMILGVSGYSVDNDGKYVATSFDNFRRFRVPNNWNIDDLISKDRKNG